MSNAQMDPSLQSLNSGGAGPNQTSRYPSPFFDISQQYIPPTIKELFKWVFFYCTNNSFLGPAIHKISRYPVTDLVFEDPNPESVKHWQTLMNNTLQIKSFNMEVNTDLTSYGNAFVSLHFPFSRFLQCATCGARHPWKAVQKKIENLTVKIKCPKCGADGAAKLIDVPYKSLENFRLLRINPEFIDIKYNDSTGRHIYLYSIPDRLKRQIMAGDPDILEDTPQLYFDAIKQRRKIRLSSDNLFHLKNPTLAGKDMGWGLPRIAVALKDLFHFYTLRRAQEAVMLEHITPFDMIFPNANGKMDPYIHTDLSSWKRQMQKELANRRRDPNYKAILPFPVGFERIGGDGKALMLTPEMDFLSKSIIGAMGIPQEFVYGGTMNWTGSSIALRTLENDFLHQRSQLLQMNIWLVERIRLYIGASAPKSIRFTDFKMADDIQKLQLMIGMASSQKLPWEDIQRELGRDPVIVRKKIEEEAEFDARIRSIAISRDAESQAMAMQVQARYAAKQQSNTGGQNEDHAAVDRITAESVAAFAEKLITMPPEEIEAAIARVKELDIKFADLIERAIENLQNGHPAVPSALDIASDAQAQQGEAEAAQQQQQMEMEQQGQQAQLGMQDAAHKQKLQHNDAAHKQKMEHQKAMAKMKVNMKPAPEQRPPRRKGGV